MERGKSDLRNKIFLIGMTRHRVVKQGDRLESNKIPLELQFSNADFPLIWFITLMKDMYDSNCHTNEELGYLVCQDAIFQASKTPFSENINCCKHVFYSF